MEYFVGYLIENDASDYYKQITSDIAQRFGIINLSLSIPAHLTLKIPNVISDLQDFENYVSDIASKTKVSELYIDGFEKFDGKKNNTIYLSVSSKDGMQNIENAVDKLESYKENIKNIERPLKLHSSIARFLNTEQCAEIWNYIQTIPKPNFTLEFNNITIFKRVGHDFLIHKTYLLKQ